MRATVPPGINNVIHREPAEKYFRAAGGNTEVRAVDGINLSVEPKRLLHAPPPRPLRLRQDHDAALSSPRLERPGFHGPHRDRRHDYVFDSAKGIFVPASDRGIGMVFQSYAVWPHMTVFQNVAFPLRVSRARKYSSAEIKERVRKALEMVRLAGFEQRSSTQLSGGQQQRLALARGLVHEPKVLLLDEPLSNLDAKLREQMRFELKHLQRSLGITTVYVTHDQAEALALSDEIAVFNSGRIVQRGGPQDIYSHPATRFVADFIGSANFLAGSVTREAGPDGLVGVATAHGTFRCPFAQPVTLGQKVVVTARPEDLMLYASPPGDAFNVLAGTVSGRVFLGDVIDYIVNVGETDLRIRARPEHVFGVRESVHIGIAPQKCVGLPA